MRILEIECCDDCPHFDNENYGYCEFCIKLERKIPQNKLHYNHSIPDDCPLPRKELSDKDT